MQTHQTVPPAESACLLHLHPILTISPTTGTRHLSTEREPASRWPPPGGWARRAAAGGNQAENLFPRTSRRSRLNRTPPKTSRWSSPAILSIRKDVHAATYDALPSSFRGSRPRPREWGVMISRSPSSNPTSSPAHYRQRPLSESLRWPTVLFATVRRRRRLPGNSLIE